MIEPASGHSLDIVFAPVRSQTALEETVERADDRGIDELDRCVLGMDATLHAFPRYRRFDVRLHIGVAELTQSQRPVALMTGVEASASSLLAHIDHPPEMLERSNEQHRRLLERLRRRDAGGAGRAMAAHARYTEAALGELLPGVSA